MAKDPAFLFYPNDWVGGTMGMTFEEKGAYMELLMLQFNVGHMTGHMIGQVVGQTFQQIQSKFTLDEKGLYYNERLEAEKNKRQSYTQSRNNNKIGKNQHAKNGGHMTGHTIGHTIGHMTGHMENENSILNYSLPKKEFKGVVGENFVNPFLTKRMAEIFYKFNPNDMPDDSEDLRSCFTISQKIEIAKKWDAGSSLNGKMEDSISEWEKILEHIQTKDFFKKFSLKNISNQFQSVWKSYISGEEEQTKKSFKKIDLKVDKTIRGISCSEDCRSVTLSDGSKVEVVGDQIWNLKNGYTKPDEFYKGINDWE